MKIKVFKLINGEELIASVEDTEHGYILKDPAAIVIQQTDKGLGVGLAPYMPYAVSEITLNRTAVVSAANPNLNMENEYNRIFGSGIQIAGAGSIK